MSVSRTILPSMLDVPLRRALWTAEDMAKLEERIGSIPPPDTIAHPSMKHLEAALEICFWASQQTNEQRPTEGTLVFATEQSCTQSIAFDDDAVNPRIVSSGSVQSVAYR